jgi:heme A synthase
MIQGLLGGFRVMLNELVGTDLATIHGIFAQIVFCLLVALAILTGRGPVSDIPGDESPTLNRRLLALSLVLFGQVILGAFVRHAPTPLTQRLHFLVAFVATGLAIWTLIAIFAQPAARRRVRAAGWLLGVLLALQLTLGVEAWMAKFGSYTLPELVKITNQYAAIRTAHAFIGSALLATAVAIAVQLRRTTATPVPKPDTAIPGWYDSSEITVREMTAVARLRGTAP